MRLKKIGKTLAGRAIHPPFKPAETLRCPSKKWPGHNGHRLPPARKPVKLQIFPIVTNARCRLHVAPTAAHGNSQLRRRIEFQRGIANARKWRGGKERRPVLMLLSALQMLGNQCLRKSPAADQNIWLALIENRPPSALKHHLLEM